MILEVPRRGMVGRKMKKVTLTRDMRENNRYTSINFMMMFLKSLHKNKRNNIRMNFEIGKYNL